jgi:restriction system protein
MAESPKGLFITTGTFSPAAVREATRDGAPPIDLVDGVELAAQPPSSKNLAAEF